MSHLQQIFSGGSGLLLLSAVAFSAIGLWRYFAVTQVRIWRWALIALAFSVALRLALHGLAVAWASVPNFEKLETIYLVTADLGIIAQATLFLAVARALVLMARAQEKSLPPGPGRLHFDSGNHEWTGMNANPDDE